MSNHWIVKYQVNKMIVKTNRLLFLILALTGCAGPMTDQPQSQAQVRIVKGPPLAEDLQPEEKKLIKATGAFYTVQPGDTLWAVATIHNVDVEQLANWNQITDPNQLHVGQTLRIQPEQQKPQLSTPLINPIESPKQITQQPISEPWRVQKKIKTPPITAKEPSTQEIPTPKVNTPQRNDTQELVSIVPIPKRPTIPYIPKPTFNVRKPPPKPAKPLSKEPPQKWIWPHNGRIISRFGKFGARQNTGIDINAKPGDPIVAAASGVVAYADKGVTGYGNMILLRHDGAFMTAYAHIDKILVNRGDSIRIGQIIALSGQTGITQSPRLHFEIRQRITPVNPLNYLPKR